MALRALECSCGSGGEAVLICVCARLSMFVALDTLLRGAERFGERDALRLGGTRGRSVSVLVSVVRHVESELAHEVPRRALRRDVLRESRRRMLSRKSTGIGLVWLLCALLR